MNIQGKCVVDIHYTLTGEDGTVIDSSEGRDPLRYMHGVGMLVPGLERSLEGQGAGDAFKVVVQPEDGYGDFDPDLVQQVEHSALEGVEDLQVGMQLEARSPEGDTHYVIVDEVTNEHVTLNANAPLAGVVLHFDIKIEGVREATEEEIEHGHPH